ncbi:potassium channel family protein [Pukyongiella litopenaei]|uniref:Two pore domain potassium channel family protein n=1 Tax=Pukyongiella litopenaei TaxID=2605946 RepID=A0A2S0MLA7_9RHOB|nr:potassium channel family protein [Pukyongiella litopenaei]AVO36473.1 two pore domain potassium channel family protein [Pukyongiella litopenaei]
MISLRAAIILGSLLAVVAGGTVFFHVVEGWSWIDSYFFTVVTISTVGYGKLVPATTLGKIGTTAFIFLGLGTFAAAIQYYAQHQIRQRELRTAWLIRRLTNQQRRSHRAANEDDAPGG